MEIERDIVNAFKAWKDERGSKPILLKGARQIGKTWAMESLRLQRPLPSPSEDALLVSQPALQ